MNTQALKPFAQQARKLCREGVLEKLRYWGFEADGSCQAKVEATSGGYIFRAQVFNDPSVPKKWQKLADRIQDSKSFEDLLEEAAYTWFNRLMAMQILEKNEYEAPLLAYMEAARLPALLQMARRGEWEPQRSYDRKLLREYLLEEKDREAFSLLLVDHCNRHPLLSKVFGSIDDYTELLIPANLLRREGLLDLFHSSEAITAEDYRQVELIGWLYQFYISDKKDEVFKNKQKVRPQDIPAATQIFTPRWIVSYMVENTLGQLWLEQEAHSSLREEMKYLVPKADGNAPSPGLNLAPEELRLLDPAAGSGHILVVAFELLMKIYSEAGYSRRQSASLILKHNLYGLDLDLRAAQLARFALLLKAAQYDRNLLEAQLLPHIYSMPAPAYISIQHIQVFLGTEGAAFTQELQEALQEMQLAHNIGSALKLKLSEQAHDFISQRWEAFKEEESSGELFSIHTSPLKDYIPILLILCDQYPAVVANPPYMGGGNMNAELKAYVNKHYKLSKSDLFAVFMEVCLNRIHEKGKMGMINQQSWMFLSSYEKLRLNLLDHYGIESMLHLGTRTFDEISGEVVNSTAFVFSADKNHTGEYHRLISYKNSTEKESAFLERKNHFPQIPQDQFSKIPGSPIAYWVSERVLKVFEESEPLSKNAAPRQGFATGDNKRFLRYWFEVDHKKIGLGIKNSNEALKSKKKWFPCNKGGPFRKWFGNNQIIVNWENDGNELRNFSGSVIRNQGYYFKNGLTWSTISSSAASFRFSPEGYLFESKGSVCFVNNQADSLFLLGYLNSHLVNYFLSIFSPTLDFHEGPVGRLPVKNIGNKLPINFCVNAAIDISKSDWDNSEKSFEFLSSPVLNQRVIDLSNGYELWLEKVSIKFYRLHTFDEALNRIFLGIYGLEDELSPEVELRDITILQEELDRSKLPDRSNLNLPEDRFEESYWEGLEELPAAFPKLPIKQDLIIEQFISYCVGLLMGRYRLDKPGLHIAHPSPTAEELAPYQTAGGESFQIDEDGIIPLMGEESPFSDDMARRLIEVIRLIWGEESLTANLNFIRSSLGTDLEKYLSKKFWTYHKKVYKKKPIYWLFQSASKHFQVLVYMHRLSPFTVQQIRSSYLHPYQEWLATEAQQLEAEEASLDKAGQKRLDLLRKARIDCREYDEVLKDIAAREISIDLDDGVTANLEKFKRAVAKV